MAEMKNGGEGRWVLRVLLAVAVGALTIGAPGVGDALAGLAKVVMCSLVLIGTALEYCFGWAVICGILRNVTGEPETKVCSCCVSAADIRAAKNDLKGQLAEAREAATQSKESARAAQASARAAKKSAAEAEVTAAAGAAAAAEAAAAAKTTATAPGQSDDGAGGGGQVERSTDGAPTPRGSSSQGNCVVCLSPRPETYAFLPCGHACACGECSAGWVVGGEVGSPPSCPVCRGKVSGTVRVYLN